MNFSPDQKKERTLFHQNRTKTFEQLTFAEQAKSINAQVVTLQRSIRAHIRRANAEQRPIGITQQKCHAQIQRLLARI